MTKYATAGIASYLPGMKLMAQFINEAMEYHIRSLEEQLAPQDGAETARNYISASMKQAIAGETPKGRQGEQWAKLSAEERSAEMKRRLALGRANRPTHPRDPRHPGHDAWIAKLRKSQKKAWSNLTPAEQKIKIAKMRGVK